MIYSTDFACCCAPRSLFLASAQDYLRHGVERNPKSGRFPHQPHLQQPASSLPPGTSTKHKTSPAVSPERIPRLLPATSSRKKVNHRLRRPHLSWCAWPRTSKGFECGEIDTHETAFSLVLTDCHLTSKYGEQALLSSVTTERQG